MKQSEPILFPPFRLDPVNEQLWRDQRLIALPPKIFAVLRHLVENAGRLVTKEELFAAVWLNTRVSEGVLKGYIHHLREVLGDDPTTPRFIETVPRRGHRFIAQVVSSQHSVVSRRTVVSPLPAPPLHFPLATGHWPPTTFLVGRESELTRLHNALEKADRGERQLVFVTGEPGIGKTTVVEEFLRRALTPMNYWLGRGQCVEHYGSGEAYLPVLEALGHVGRTPGGEHLIALLNQHAPTWLVQMPALLTAADLEALQRRVAGATRERMLREMIEAIDVLTTQRTLVLWLEDLHWADHSTLDWLTAVAQRSGPARLLLLGTYRPAEVSVSNHPLKAVKQELLARGQCEEVWVPVLSTEEISRYLTLRYTQHQFPDSLTTAIHHRTEGNPLFLINTVDYLMAQGVLVEIEGQWQLGVSLQEVTQGVPENLRQLIEKHFERLDETQQRLLETASVAGNEFLTAATAAGAEVPVEQVEEQCEVLTRRGQFLRAGEPVVLPNGTITGRYEFLHSLYQAVLYERIAPLRRIQLHRRIGAYKAAAYGEQTGDIAGELAMHFERGREPRQAVRYLQQAGMTALSRSAYQEALNHLSKGVQLVQSWPEAPERVEQEVALLVVLGTVYFAIEGYASARAKEIYQRARELSQQQEKSPQLFSVLRGLWTVYSSRAEIRAARALGEQMVQVAEQRQDPLLQMAAHYALGAVLLWMGNFVLAKTHLNQGLALCRALDPESRFIHSVQDQEVTCQGWLAWAEWFLGYPEQGLQKKQETHALARVLLHPHTSVWAFHMMAHLQRLAWGVSSLQTETEEAVTLAAAHGFPVWVAWGVIDHGVALVKAGQAKEGLAQIRAGMQAYQETGTQLFFPCFQVLLAEAYGKVGLAEEGLREIAAAQDTIERSEERFYEAELYRLKGELLLQQVKVQGSKFKVKIPQSSIPNPVSEAEACFHQAIALARQQQTKSLELRAVMSLVRLRQRQARNHITRNTQHGLRAMLVEAHTMLSELYHWFTEGFDTADLKAAKALLDELSISVPSASQIRTRQAATKSPKRKTR